MNGLPDGQFIDYLIIAIVAGAAATIVGQLVKAKLKTVPRQIVFAVVFLAVGVGGHFVFMQERKEELHVDRSGATVLQSPIGPSLGKSSTPLTTPTPVIESLEQSFVRQFIAPSEKSLRIPGQWAVVITAPESQENYSRLVGAVSAVLTERGQSTSAIFRPAATRGPGFEALFAADPALSRRLHEYCDQIFLGKVVFNMKSNSISPGLLSVTLTLNGKIVSTRTGNVQHHFELSAVGAGYSSGEAKTNAEETLAANLRSELLTVIK